MKRINDVKYTNKTDMAVRLLINGGELTMEQREEIYLYISDLETKLEELED